MDQFTCRFFPRSLTRLRLTPKQNHPHFLGFMYTHHSFRTRHRHSPQVGRTQGEVMPIRLEGTAEIMGLGELGPGSFLPVLG
jgi:hypothetical protein